MRSPKQEEKQIIIKITLGIKYTNKPNSNTYWSNTTNKQLEVFLEWKILKDPISNGPKQPIIVIVFVGLVYYTFEPIGLTCAYWIDIIFVNFYKT